MNIKCFIGLVALLFCTNYSYSQIHCDEGPNSLSQLTYSQEDTSQNGICNFHIKLVSHDSVWIDSFSFVSDYFVLNGINKSFPLYLDSGDSLILDISISYDSSNIPYYYKSVDNLLFFHNSKMQNSFSIAPINIYFTPWGTTEIWNLDDFSSLPRVWEIPKTPEPNRVFIPKDSIPISNRPPLDSINLEWETDFQKISYPNLPFAIEMAAAHPDSLAGYILLDSIQDPGDSNSNSNSIIIGKTFKGRITGRLLCNYINDMGNPVIIPLAGIFIKVKEDDITGNAGNHTGYNITLTSGYTDDNGNFDLSYSVFNSYLDGSQIEPYLEFVTKSDRFNFKVKRIGAGDEDNPYNTFIDLPKAGRNYFHEQGDIVLEDERSYPYRIASWTYKSYRFFEDQANDYKLESRLRIKLFYEGRFGSFTNPVLNTIYLEPGDERHESVIWHELGHIVMYNLMPNTLIAASGDHTSRDENNFQLAWSEGWATGFMSILDAYYRQWDQEFGLYGFDEGSVIFNPFPTERMNRTRLRTFGTNGIGIRSEYLIGTVLYDLFDGPSYFNNIQEYDDHFFSDPNDPNDGFDEGIFDDVQLPITIIFEAITENNNSICDYYRNILELLGNDCDLKKKVKKVFDQNRVNLNTSDITTVTNNFSSDEIEVGVTHTEVIVPLLVSISTFVNTDRNLIELASGADRSYNIKAENSGSNNIKTISDNLIVRNDGVLGINANRTAGWANTSQSSPPPSGSHLTVRSCINVLSIQNHGTLEIGDGNAVTTGELIITSGTRLELNTTTTNNPAVIVVHNNSKLTIEEGAQLIYYPGAQIILDGENAILEIKGTVRIMNGATFTVLEGNSGFGFVRVVKNYPPSSQAFVAHNNQTSKIEFIGNGNTDKLLEIKGTDGLYIGMPGELVINNCKVELESGSKLNPEVTTLSIDEVNIVAFNSTLGHRGVMIPGYTKTHIYYTNIEDGKWGLWFYKRGIQKAIDIRYVYIDDCETGIISEGVDFNFYTGAITNYDINGIRAEGLTGLTNIENIQISLGSQSSTITGLYQTGSGTVFINKSTFNNNRRGIESWDGNMTLRCTEITNSAELGVIGEVTAKLKMGGGAGGYNLFENNANHLVSRYWGQWIIKDGHNVLKGPNSVPLFWVSMGYNVPFVNAGAKTMNGSLNLFYGGSSSPWTISNPRNLEMKGAGGLNLENHDVSSSTLGTYLGDIQGVCSGSGPCNPCELAHPYNSGGHGEVTQVITTGLFGTGPITEQIAILVDSANIENPDYSYVLMGYCQMLNFSYVDSPPAALQGLLKDVYSDKMSIYQRAMSSYSESSAFDHTTLCDNMLQCNAGLISKAKSNKFPWKDMMYELYRDRAAIYRFKSDYENTFESLDSGLIYVSSDAGKTNHLQYLQCLYTGEKAVIDSIIPPDSIFAYFPCTLESNATSSPNNSQLNNSKDEKSNKYTIYPNPTDGFVYIEGINIKSVSVLNYLGESVNCLKQLILNRHFGC
jgi:hypothetical protein